MVGEDMKKKIILSIILLVLILMFTIWENTFSYPINDTKSTNHLNQIRISIDKSGMIPVIINNDGTVTTVSKDDPKWYDYENKQWANAILVNSNARNTYLNTSGINVSIDDILAYYVYIPRYKYKIWTNKESSEDQKHSIDIIFENSDTPLASSTKVGKYKTHPAFWWDNNNNSIVDSGELLDGIWVGKFESSEKDESPIILPNVISAKEQTVSTMFKKSLTFSGGILNNDGVITFKGNSIYGLSSKTDSHMMKNSEWGAVAYLSHSIYGINNQIRINNNNNYTTGCGSLYDSKEYLPNTEECEIEYGKSNTYPQSTTGNISGIFDMSGGAWDIVMGVYADNNKNPRSGYNANYNSGFTGTLKNGSTYNGINFPPSKYYDLYTMNKTADCTLDSCSGHSLYETANWYPIYNFFAASGGPWFRRGAAHCGGIKANIFSYGSNYGSGAGNATWRSVLLNF